MISPIRFEDGVLSLLDQRRLPLEETWISCRTVPDVVDAIRDMVVRGAPAIGVTAAYGMVLAAGAAAGQPADAFRERLEADAQLLEGARPTAVNLTWAVRRLLGVAGRALDDGLAPGEVARRLTDAANAMFEQDVEANRRIGRHGSLLVPDRARILTHCNAGALATAGYGTALGIVRAAVEEGKEITVVADETRPFLQGSRLTAWELDKDGIPVELITDSMAGALMARGEIDLVVVGADRIARNGDVANKIGTYSVAVLARRHGIPMYVAAPLSTIDAETPTGDDIPIEERDPQDVVELDGKAVAPEGVRARHIAFDVTPASLVTAIVTEEGVARAPFSASIGRMLGLEEEEPEPVDEAADELDEEELAALAGEDDEGPEPDTDGGARIREPATGEPDARAASAPDEQVAPAADDEADRTG